MEQGRPVARRTDPGTSWAAADSVADETITATKKAILRALRLWGPMTDYGISLGVRGSLSGLRTRRKELTDAGLVVDTGMKQRLPSGRWAILWGMPEGQRLF